MLILKHFSMFIVSSIRQTLHSKFILISKPFASRVNLIHIKKERNVWIHSLCNLVTSYFVLVGVKKKLLSNAVHLCCQEVN